MNACPRPRGVGQIHRDLGILDPPGGAGVLALGAHGARTLLDVSGLVDHEDPIVAEPIHDIATQVVADPIVVPGRASQQVL